MNKGDLQRIQHIKTYCEDINGFVERFGNDLKLMFCNHVLENAG